MRRLRPGSVPLLIVRRAASAAALGLALALAGCANPADRSVGSIADARTATPPQSVASTSVRMSNAQQDWVVARAVTTHEMRRP